MDKIISFKRWLMHDDQFEQFDKTMERINKRNSSHIFITEENSIKLKHSFIKLLLVLPKLEELTIEEKYILNEYSKQVINKLD